MNRVRWVITDHESGKTVDGSYRCEKKYLDTQEFWWSDGNGGCDCNRELYFWREQGIEPEDDCDENGVGTCLGTKRYTLEALYVRDVDLVQSMGWDHFNAGYPR